MLRKIGCIFAMRDQLNCLGSLGLNNSELCSNMSFSGRKCDVCEVKAFHSCTTLNSDLKKNFERERTLKARFEREADSEALSIGFKRILDTFPDKDQPYKVFSGIMYKDIPIVNIKVSGNNTIINLTDAKGLGKLIKSCGTEGFKNAKKGTNMAAQATATAFGRKAVDLGYKTVRIRIKGSGPGRLSSVRGLLLGGLDIVSLTDNTPVTENPVRGKKLRRV